MRKIEKYINSINTSAYKEGIISVVLYDAIKDTHLYLFNFNHDEDGLRYCVMMCEPINEELPYVELSLPYVDQLDYYFKSYIPEKDSKDIGKHYKQVMKRLKLKEEKLLKQR